jgi:hypothetical protein
MSPLGVEPAEGSQTGAWRSSCYAEGMNNIIYIVGLVVVVIAVLSFFGLR